MTCNKYNSKPLNPLETALQNIKSDFPKIFENLENHELQIRYTQVQLNQENNLETKTYTYQQDSLFYFYPASTVKMPVAFLALEKIDRLKKRGYPISIDTPIRFESGPMPLTEFSLDSTAFENKITIRHLINRVFSVSDNNAYNRLYEFLGRDAINNRLRQLNAFSNSRIVHRVGAPGFTPQSNGWSNSFSFYENENENEKTIYKENIKIETTSWSDLMLQNSVKGKAYINSAGTTINKPFDMGQKNFISLSDLESCLLRIIYPELFKKEEKFEISDEHRSFLLHAMARLPKEQLFPKYNTTEYYDAYGKFFIYGDTKKPIPDHIRIFNKVGYAYGTLTECAFVVDLKNGISFFLTATILVNENQIFNDGVYEYDEFGIPFLGELGREIYQYELARIEPQPDLSQFDLDFEREFIFKNN